MRGKKTMTEQYRWPHAVATVLAGAAVAYQTAVIWESLTGVSTTTKMGVPLATVAAAILPVLAEAAWRSGAKGKAIIMALPVFVLLAYVLPSGLSRLGEAQETRIVTAAKAGGELTKLQADLDKADKLVAEAGKWVAAECRSGRGTKCKGVEFVENQRKAYQRELQTKIAGYSAPVQPWLPSWHPATLTIGLELAIIGALFYGLGPLVAGRKPVAIAEPEFNDSDLMPAPEQQDNVLSFCKAFKEANGRKPSIEEVQSKFPSIARTTAWRRAAAA